MAWTKNQIEQHLRAAGLLGQIKNETLRYILAFPGVSEREVQEFLYKRFEELGLCRDEHPLIVAFGANTQHVHYYPPEDSLLLSPESLIMIDVWGRIAEESAPFADMTWVAWKGGAIPSEIQKVAKIVFQARDCAISFLKQELLKKRIPTGKGIDDVSRGVVADAGYGEMFPHTTGHPLGFSSVHGEGVSLGRKGDKQIELNVGYTIEPGVYLKDLFGVRSEVDFYVTDGLELVITTEVQREIEFLRQIKI
ncbi:hypothetical protein A3A21_00335 [Candidatus Jorgensenbacteria bacterium RIFCSPLOWO2_01_FULL_45_25b]|uniref:Peptidase M24 domain-containing protein n=1 Tax=Candidatus Jorgensenbacteria bacterium RIFCSPLOWO2_01_FULL_45_25b TaxID=1798471 RepID=A0A1F6BUT7_9BACT|nr:MAG: hypothetical protein A3A21_00335 [Candidatus Jorgensenbacteria bacterium RIFCSPLOWO2_01_FULL_45_25b]